MRLSVITITYNNLSGLQRTIASVYQQRYTDFEVVVVDGGSTDGTVEFLQNDCPYSNLRWISEQDKGIYDAQNKGIALAKGDYCFFLNAGDAFCSDDVLERMFANLTSPLPQILYGNELLMGNVGQVTGRATGVENPTFLDIYNGCMKHQATFVHHSLFEQYGSYDATMRMDADWDWFMRVVGFHAVTMEYRNVDITFFETNGYSYTHPEVDEAETRIVLERYLPSEKMQQDYRIFSRYAQLRSADRIPVLRFSLRVIMKLSKIYDRWHSK